MKNYIQIFNHLIDYWYQEDRNVVTPITPDELSRKIIFQLTDEPSSVDELAQYLKCFIDYSPDVSQVNFHKQLYSGINEPAVLGEWISALVNSVMHTYKVGPVATLMELEIIRNLNNLVGFKQGEGLMLSGASQSNLIAMMLARHNVMPNIKKEGYQGKTLTAYVSDQAHYSMLKAANVLGIGENNLIQVKSDEHGRLCPKDLHNCIRQDVLKGKQPFFIGLTAGTTVVGAYDPVIECHKIADENNIWLHIDGAWGAPVLFSSKYKNILADSELADSFTWDAHKFLNVPLTAGIILVKQRGILRDCISGGGGDYLFHKKDESIFNLGELSIQSARRADCLKVWSAWKVTGASGFESKVDSLQKSKEFFITQITKNKDFEIIAPAPFLNILFQYKPNGIYNENLLKEINIGICNTLADEGKYFIDYANFKGCTGIRIIFANDQITEEYIKSLIIECRRVGEVYLHSMK